CEVSAIRREPSGDTPGGSRRSAVTDT
ncbi:MAG TPA: hypothetical protein DDX19_15830, partial [Rhodopirellula baltica]|nr:hypothetical protein [Rhodopirellula baltica]